MSFDRATTRLPAAGRKRRGVTILLVMGLLSVTLALSYVIMRAQVTTTVVQNNSNLDALARQAAATGMATAYRKMFDASWGGVTSVVSATLATGQSYSVTYATGDPNLGPSSPNYADFPYRVTLLSTGTAVDPAHPNVAATHRTQAVVHLIPRQLYAEPSAWSTMLQYTVYQYTADNFSLQVPCQVTGAVRVQGSVLLCPDYPPSSNGLSQYLGDLNLMRNPPPGVSTLASAITSTTSTTCNVASGSAFPTSGTFLIQVDGEIMQVNSVSGNSFSVSRGQNGTSASTHAAGAGASRYPAVVAYGDYRPILGPLTLPTSQTSGSVLGLLNSQLGVTTINLNASNTTNWTFPTNVSTYQVFPGGQVYSVPVISQTLSNTTLAPDPVRNPLGIFYASNKVTINSNVSITGTLIAAGDIYINGKSVTLQSYSLPALNGSSQPTQLPVAVTSGNFQVDSQSQVTVRGLVAVKSSFDILPGSQSTTFNLQGRVMCKGFYIEDRTEWTQWGFLWSFLWTWFGQQLSPLVPSTMTYYPVWLNQSGMNMVPTLTVAPETSSVLYHWKDATDPVFVANTNDGGLRWWLVSWNDSL
jgi:hypothetical protein